jgi:hypothetical protein
MWASPLTGPSYHGRQDAEAGSARFRDRQQYKQFLASVEHFWYLKQPAESEASEVTAMLEMPGAKGFVGSVVSGQLDDK